MRTPFTLCTFNVYLSTYLHQYLCNALQTHPSSNQIFHIRIQVFSRFRVRAQFGSPELGRSNPIAYTGLLQMPNIVATSSRQNTNSLPNTTSAAMRFYEARYVRVSTSNAGPLQGLQRLARCPAVPCAKFLERITAARVYPRQLIHAVASLSPSRGKQTHIHVSTEQRVHIL